MPVLNGTGQLAACARPVMAGHASRPSAHGPEGVRGGQAGAQAVLEAQCCNAASAKQPAPDLRADGGGPSIRPRWSRASASSTSQTTMQDHHEHTRLFPNDTLVATAR